MIILTLLSYTGVVLGFSLLTLAIASGLYYVSEIIEEHSVAAKKFLRRSIYAIIIIHILLYLVDGLSFWLTLLSIFTQIIHYQNLSSFPFIRWSSPPFILSCILVITNHILWFNYFSNPDLPGLSYRAADPYYAAPNLPSYAQVSSFFGICIWFIPFSLFVSLSAGDFVLPASNDGAAAGERKSRKSSGLIKVVITQVYEFVLNILKSLGFSGIGKRKDDGFL